MGFGIAAMRVVNLGLDPFGAMILGISYRTGISFGTTIWIVHSPIFVIMLFRARRLIGIGTILGMFVVGYAIDFFYYIASVLELEPGLFVRVVALVPALVVFAFGIALYMVADVGTVPYDSCGVMIEDATKGRVKFKWGRIGMDAICLVVAFVLGATLGVGTVLPVVTLGPLISFFRKRLGNDV